jgi:hypothetical protein
MQMLMLQELQISPLFNEYLVSKNYFTLMQTIELMIVSFISLTNLGALHYRLGPGVA